MTFCDLLGRFVTFCDVSGRFGTLWDVLGGSGGVLGRFGTFWDILVQIIYSLYFRVKVVVNASFNITMSLWSNRIMLYGPCHNNQHTGAY